MSDLLPTEAMGPETNALVVKLKARVKRLEEVGAMTVQMVKQFYESERNEYMSQQMKDYRRQAVFAVARDLEAALEENDGRQRGGMR